MLLVQPLSDLPLVCTGRVQSNLYIGLTICSHMDQMRAIIDTRSLCAIPAVLGPLTRAADFRPDAEGWTVFAYSAAGDRAVEVRLPANAFREFCTPAPFSVDLLDLDRLCSMVKGTTDVELEIGARIVARVDGVRVTIPTEPFEADSKKSPSKAAERMDFSAEAVVQPSRFSMLFKTSDQKAVDACTVTLDDKGLTLDATNEDMGKGVAVTVPLEDITSDGAARAVYSLAGLKGLFAAVPGDPLCDMRFGTDYPLTMGFKVGYLDVLYLIAPRIESE